VRVCITLDFEIRCPGNPIPEVVHHETNFSFEILKSSHRNLLVHGKRIFFIFIGGCRWSMTVK